jgi:hypothetical protein
MLINDLKYFERSSNYHNKYSGMDTPTAGRIPVAQWHAYPIQDFDYQFNSWGFRGPEYDQYVGKAVNICLGDSFTVNVGGPVEHSWCSQLAEHFDIPTVNLGMDGAGNDAIQLVYSRACEVFDVQNTFVMYSYLHRRLIDKIFKQCVNDFDTDIKYWKENKIPTDFEVALPVWNWSDQEKKFLREQGLFFLDLSADFRNHLSSNRKITVGESSYNNLRGSDWPTYAEFINGADPHPDMFTKEFGQFIFNGEYTNRDGHHMNQEANKIYADYFYNQWKIKNES